MGCRTDPIFHFDSHCPFIYEDFTDSKFDDVDEMILNCYNAVSMNLGAEASLFRQVPSTRTLTHADMLIPTIRSNYIASTSKVDYDIMHRRFGHPLKEVL